MLATVLHSPVATQTSIAIIRTFKKLREFSKYYNTLAKKILQFDIFLSIMFFLRYNNFIRQTGVIHG